MKNLLLLFVVAITILSSCVTDDPYIPPVVETGDVVLNEVMSKDPVTDLDWVELYNTTDAEVDISGYLLNDKADPAGGFVLPEGSIIPANGYFLVNEGTDFTFGISSSGEDLSLGDVEGNLLDLVTVPPSNADGTTFSRIPDGGETWVNGTEATPGAANVGDATTPSVSVDFNVAPVAGEPVELTITYATSETVTEVAVFYAAGDAAYDAANKMAGTMNAGTATVTMTDLNVAGEKVSFFVAVTLDGGDVYYYDKDNKSVELSALTADMTLWNAYTAISGSVAAPTLTLTYSSTPTAGYEAVELEFEAEIEITEARIYFAAGDSPEYIKNNKVKGEDEESFTQTGVVINMANHDVENGEGTVVGTTSDAGVMISFYVRIVLVNGFEYYYDKDGNVFVDDGSIDTDDAATDDFKADPSLWNTYTNKAAATVSSITFPATPAATDDINVVLAFASDEEIVEARIYFAGSEGLYVKDNKFKGEDEESFTQTGVTINMRDMEVLKADGTTTDGTTSTSGAIIKFYFRIATATSEYYFSKEGDTVKLFAVDDSPADGAFDSSDAFKDDSSLWLSYTVQ